MAMAKGCKLTAFSVLHCIICLITTSRAKSLADNNRSIVSEASLSLIDMYLCEIDNKHWNEGKILLASVSNAVQNRFTRLSCMGEHLLYDTISETDFVKGIRENGALELLSPVRKFEPRTFCIEDYNAGLLKIAACNNSVVKKCCPAHQRLQKLEESSDELTCIDVPRYRKWNFAEFRSTSDEYNEHYDMDDNSNVSVIYGRPKCKQSYKSLNNSKDIWFMMLTNGSVEVGLRFWFKPVWLPLEHNDYCVDEIQEEDRVGSDSHLTHHKNQILLYCEIASFDDYLYHRKLFGGMCISAAGCVFLLLLIYISIWDKQNLSGWTQFNIFVALFFVLLMEGLRTVTEANGLLVVSTSTCVVIAAVAQFFFFALNTTWCVMSIDLFYVFWKPKNMSINCGQYGSKLVTYLMLSWGVPLVVVCVAFYYTHRTATVDMDERKGVYAFAHRRCSSPIRSLGFQTQGILFIVNLIFFLLTTVLIWKHRRGLNATRMRSGVHHNTWRTVCLFMKLVILMGVSSLSIPIDYFLVSSAPLSRTAVYFRAIHFIPVVAVLFIFGFNTRNLMLLREKYPRIQKFLGFIMCNSTDSVHGPVNTSRRSIAVDHHSSPL